MTINEAWGKPGRAWVYGASADREQERANIAALPVDLDSVLHVLIHNLRWRR